MKHDSDEVLNTTSLEHAATYLPSQNIIYHGLFKLYSPMKNTFVDVAGILTEKQLYMLPEVKYKIWKELRDRNKIDVLINGTEHDDNKMINLSSFDLMNVIELNTSDSYGFCMNDNKSNTIIISTSSNNVRHEWVTHLDYIIWKCEGKITDRTINSDEHFEQKQTCKKTEEENEYDTDFSFGMYLNYWETNVQNSVIPKYESLKDELLSNNICKISQENYYKLYEQCAALHKIKAYQIKAQHTEPYNKQYNVSVGSEISINHLIALKVFTDFTSISNSFRKGCRKYNTESMQQFIERNREIAEWCRYLKESIIFFGESMHNKTVYTELENKLIFSSLIQHFECPISTTKDLPVALTFSGGSGIVLELKSLNYNPTLRYFDT
eukprot:3891_1